MAKVHTTLSFLAFPFCRRLRDTPQTSGERSEVFVIVQPHEIHLSIFGRKARHEQFFPCLWLYPRAPQGHERDALVPLSARMFDTNAVVCTSPVGILR